MHLTPCHSLGIFIPCMCTCPLLQEIFISADNGDLIQIEEVIFLLFPLNRIPKGKTQIPTYVLD